MMKQQQNIVWNGMFVCPYTFIPSNLLSLQQILK